MRAIRQIRQSTRFAYGLLALLLSVGAAQASVEISTDATKNMSCSSGVCSPTDKKAVLNVSDLTNMLASGDVKITTGAGAVTITVYAPFSWTSTSRLTLDAFQTVSFRAAVAVAGTGAVTITTNDGGGGGDLLFFPGAKLDFWDLSSSLIINGSNFLLAGNIATLAADIAAHPSGSFALATDYDAAGDGTYNASPIEIFGGMFEGIGHTIDGLKIRSREKFVGLFGVLKQSAIARDIVLSNARVSARGPGKQHAAGSLSGENGGTIRHAFADAVVEGANGGALAGDNLGTIDACQATGRVLATYENAGGLVSWNGGTVAFSRASVKVTGTGNAGGLVGYNTGVIDDSSASSMVGGKLKTDGAAGGLVGRNYNGSIVRSSAAGAVSSDTDSNFIGGLVGSSEGGGEIVQSFATASVEGKGNPASAGGLVGSNDETAIKQSYATGKVSGKHDTGGLLGYNGSSIDEVYSVGPVSGEQETGGLVGNEDAPARTTDGYWDVDTSDMGEGCGAGSCSGMTGLTDAQLKSALPVGFDPEVWGQSPSINNGYPYLLANPPP